MITCKCISFDNLDYKAFENVLIIIGSDINKYFKGNLNLLWNQPSVRMCFFLNMVFIINILILIFALILIFYCEEKKTKCLCNLKHIYHISECSCDKFHDWISQHFICSFITFCCSILGLYAKFWRSLFSKPSTMYGHVTDSLQEVV